MVQHFTFFFFANITASCQQKKNGQEKQNKKSCQIGVQDHFQSYIPLHSLGILNILL